MLTKTIGVFGLFATSPNEMITTKLSDQVLSWLFNVNNGQSLVRYWRDVMDGHFELVPTVHNLYTVQVPPHVIATIEAVGNNTRNPAIEQIAAVLESGGISVTGFDVLAFFVGGRKVGAGTGALYRDKWIPTSLFDDFGSLSFMQHELGHLLGLDHPFLTGQKSPSYPNGEYGDPVCIMSAENFSGHKSMFAVPTVEQSPILPATDVTWQRSGPGVSPATVWRFATDFPNPQTWMTVLPSNAPPTRVRLMRPGFARGTQLVVMPGGGNTWYTVEFRPAVSWDRSFTPNATSNQTLAGVVIHEIRDVGLATDGPGWPKVQRVCYEATIPVPSTGDLDWSNGRFAVRVVRADTDWVDIEVGASLPTVLGISLEFYWGQTIESSSDGPQVEVSRVGRRCEVGVYTSKRSLYTATLEATVTTSGFESPVFRFELNNVALGSWQAPSAPFSGVANIVVACEVPTSTTAKSTKTLTVPVSYRGAGNAVTVDVPSGHGTYELSLVAYATEDPTADPSGIASAPGLAPLKTLRFVLPSEAIEDMGACIQSIADGIRHKKQWPPARDEHPVWRERIDEIWTEDHLPQLGNAIIRAAELEAVNVSIGGRVVEEAALKLRMSPNEFRDLASDVSRQVRGPK